MDLPALTNLGTFWMWSGTFTKFATARKPFKKSAPYLYFKLSRGLGDVFFIFLPPMLLALQGQNSKCSKICGNHDADERITEFLRTKFCGKANHLCSAKLRPISTNQRFGFNKYFFILSVVNTNPPFIKLRKLFIKYYKIQQCIWHC